MTEYPDLHLLLVGLLVWAAMIYNRKRKARWKKLRDFEAELQAQNLRYFLNVYCGPKDTAHKLSRKLVPLN